MLWIKFVYFQFTNHSHYSDIMITFREGVVSAFTCGVSQHHGASLAYLKIPDSCIV